MAAVMRYAQCDWTTGASNYLQDIQCPHQAAWVVLYGCIDGHTEELAMCLIHVSEFEMMCEEDRAYCGDDNCSNYVAEYQHVPIGETTVGWMKRHQRAR